MTSRDSRNRRLDIYPLGHTSIGTHRRRSLDSFVGFGFGFGFGRQSADDGTTTERRRDDGTTERDAVPIYVADDRGTTDATGGRRTGTGRATERRDTTVDDARS